MNSFADLTRWWNLIYVVPFGLGTLLVLLSVLGTGRRGSRIRGRAGANLKQVSGSSSRAAAASHGAHATHAGRAAVARAHTSRAPRLVKGHHGRFGKHHKSPARGKEAHGLGEMLHVQNIPPLMLLQNFLLFWGVLGWVANQVFAAAVPDPVRFIVPSLLTAFCGSLVITLILSAMLSRFTPRDETFASVKRDLEGRIGEAVSLINDHMGSVYARDAAGTLHHLAGRTRPGDPTIVKGEQVLVIEYQEEGDFYWVKKWSVETSTTPLSTTQEPKAE